MRNSIWREPKVRTPSLGTPYCSSNELGDLKTIQRSVIVDLMLSYRAVEAFDEMVDLIEASHDDVRDLILVRQQCALALNRRNQPGDRDKAADILEKS